MKGRKSPVRIRRMAVGATEYAMAQKAATPIAYIVSEDMRLTNFRLCATADRMVTNEIARIANRPNNLRLNPRIARHRNQTHWIDDWNGSTREIF